MAERSACGGKFLCPAVNRRAGGAPSGMPDNFRAAFPTGSSCGKKRVRRGVENRAAVCRIQKKRSSGVAMTSLFPAFRRSNATSHSFWQDGSKLCIRRGSDSRAWYCRNFLHRCRGSVSRQEYAGRKIRSARSRQVREANKPRSRKRNSPIFLSRILATLEQKLGATLRA